MTEKIEEFSIFNPVLNRHDMKIASEISEKNKDFEEGLAYLKLITWINKTRTEELNQECLKHM